MTTCGLKSRSVLLALYAANVRPEFHAFVLLASPTGTKPTFSPPGSAGKSEIVDRPLPFRFSSAKYITSTAYRNVYVNYDPVVHHRVIPMRGSSTRIRVVRTRINVYDTRTYNGKWLRGRCFLVPAVIVCYSAAVGARAVYTCRKRYILPEKPNRSSIYRVTLYPTNRRIRNLRRKFARVKTLAAASRTDASLRCGAYEKPTGNNRLPTDGVVSVFFPNVPVYTHHVLPFCPTTAASATRA